MSIETTGGVTVRACAVISGAHIHTTMQLLGDAQIAPATRTLAQRSRIGNGFGRVVRYAMSELPNDAALPSPPDGSPGPQHRALQFICPDLAYLERAFGTRLRRLSCRAPLDRPGAHCHLLHDLERRLV